MLKFAWKLIKIIFVALIIFGIISMVVSLIVTFTLSTKMATEMASEMSAHCSRQYGETLQSKNQDFFSTPGGYNAGSQFFPTASLIP